MRSAVHCGPSRTGARPWAAADAEGRVFPVSSVGQSVPRVDAREKVTGRAAFLANLAVEGMAHARLVRSTVPHATIRALRAEAARAAPGVLAVVSGQDLLAVLAEPYWGPAVMDQSPLAIGRVRYVGEPVAAVVAESAEQAEAATGLVEVEYEPLPAVFDPLEAREPGAPLLHERVRPSQAFEDLARLRPAAATNVNLHYRLRRGDVEAALAAAEVVVEGTYTYPRNQFCALEPHQALAWVDDDGRITVWSTTQSPHIVRGLLATMFGVPLERVRVRVPYLGGGFGGKTYMKLEPLAVALARLAGRPVRVALSQEEEFLLINNHAAVVRLTSGVTRDGQLLATACEVVWDSGACADIGPRIAQKSGCTAAGPYDIPNVRIDSYSVYTNLPPSGPVRGFGVPQLAWAYESHMDVVARRLGLDPLAFRRRNLLRPGRPHATGTIMEGVDFHALLDAVEQGLAHSPRPPPGGGDEGVRRGRGFAIGLKAVLTPSRSEARVEVDPSGLATVFASGVELGQGASTVLAQLAADGLGWPPERVRVVHPDTDVTPYDLIAAGSRSTHHLGRAVLDAARDARAQLLAAAAEALGEPPDQLVLQDGWVVSPRGGARLEAGEVVRRAAGQDGRIEGHGAYQTAYEHADPESGQSPRITAHWMSSAAGAEVEVDTATGRVRVLRLVVAGDAGRAIHPANCHAQLSGAATMGLGHALMEQVVFDGGQVANGSFADYLIPSILDVPPEILTAVHENEAAGGPFGAKGLGESGIFAVAPAIANAIEAAVGVRITELPITPERVYAALRNEKG